MTSIISMLLKTVLTEKVLKQLLGVLGDYLVKSSKNKLDDLMWAKVKKALGV
jgi:hypothetical protein